MKRRDEGKASLVEFLRSIKFAQENSPTQEVSHEQCPTHFAHFTQKARTSNECSTEDLQLIRSAN